MRSLLTIVVLITTIFSVVYKWRYKILNILLGVKFLRKLAVKLSMSIPGLRSNLLTNK